jgi:hypothetical protein
VSSCRQLPSELVHVVAKSFEGRRVRIAPGAEQKIARARPREEKEADELTQSSLEFIATHDRESELRNDDRDPRVSLRRLQATRVDESGFEFLARAQQVLDISGASYPPGAGKPELRLRRRRTCRAAER